MPHNPTHPAAQGTNAPLSLVPGANGAATRSQTMRAASAPIATASVPAASGGGYSVQISSQRSEADAQAAFRSLQRKYPDLLGSYQPAIRRADLGDRGVYYRVQVGPFASEQATELCSRLQTAGGQCVVQRN
jgi:cell division septation protein DedD